MARTTAALVKGILVRDYDGKTSLTPFIDTASSFVDDVVTCMSEKGLTAHSAAKLELIERWLSAWAYKQSDKALASKSTGGASGSYQGQTGIGMSNNFYGQTALRLDTSGCLDGIDESTTAEVFWAGRPPSEQTDYEDRD